MTWKARSDRQRRSRLLSQLAVVGALALAVGIQGCAKPDPLDRLPDGLAVAGDAPALRRMLARLERLALTPLGREALDLDTRLVDCTAFLGLSPDGDPGALLRAIHCTTPDEIPAELRALRGTADVAVSLAFRNGARVAGPLSVSPAGEVTFDARLRPGPDAKLASLLLPDDAPPPSPRLASRDTLLQGRFRPEGGLNVAALVPEDSQASDLFRLKSELFMGAVLDGSLEFAVYLPDDGQQIPPIALAVGFRFQKPAVAAMEKFVTDLRATWPVTPASATIAGRSGTCLDNLNILPQFAPCYVATDDALVIGWDRHSIERALQRDGAAPDDAREDAPDGLTVHLDRFPRADRLLRAAHPGATDTLEIDYGWDRLRAHTYQERGQYRLRVEMLGGDS